MEHFEVTTERLFPPETWPGYAAPIVRINRQGSAREADTGLFGLIPHWAKDLNFGRRTYNARSETVAEKPSFKDAWGRGRRCIVPAESIFEPKWTDGKAERWRISRADGKPMGIAGLWGTWRPPDGKELLSFTMLTVNADGHEVMQAFHRPEDEKRMVVILSEEDYDAWFGAHPADMAQFMRRYPAEALVTEPAPRPARTAARTASAAG